MNEIGEHIHNKLSKAFQSCGKEADKVLLEYMKKLECCRGKIK